MKADNCATGLDATFTDSEVAGTCPIISEVSRTWTLTDDCGNTTTFVQTITVQDSTAPTLNGTLDENITVNCDAIPDIPMLSFEDNCSTNISVDAPTLPETPINVTEDGYQIIRTWTVDDGCNVSTFTQTITVNTQDTIVPSNTVLCIIDDFDLDLFDLLSGNFDTSGTWTVTSGDATLDGSIFNPSSLLDANGEYSTK